MTIRTHGLRMLGVALLAGLAASCASTSPDLDVTPTARTSVDAHVGKNFSSDSTHVGDISNDFGPNETVFAVVDVPGKIEGTVKVRWIYGENETIQEQNLVIEEGVNVYRFRLIPPAGGLRAGKYRFDVYIDANRAESESFTVRAS